LIAKPAPPSTSTTSSNSVTRHHRNHDYSRLSLRSQPQGHQASLPRDVQPQKHPLVNLLQDPKQHLREQMPKYQLCSNPSITITDAETGEEWDFVDHDELDDLANSDDNRTSSEELEMNAREQEDLLYSRRWMN
jgi:hypothetical protein